MRSVGLESFIKYPVQYIQKNELVQLTIPLNSPVNNKNLLRITIGILNKKTSRLLLTFNSCADLVDYISLNQSELPPLISVKITIDDYKQFFRGNDVIYNNSNDDFLDEFRRLRKIIPQTTVLIPEIDFITNSIQVGPTIVNLYKEFNLPFLFIHVDEIPSLQKIDSIKNIFSYLRLRGFKKKIYFPFSNPNIEEWNVKTFNTFSGTRILHIDLSNKCTHSCVFCGVWGPDFLENEIKKSNGKFTPASSEFLNRQISETVINKILLDISETIIEIQFGGVGDPLTHPRWLEIITQFRSRGIRIEVLTNLDVNDKEKLKILSEYANTQYGIKFYINLSAGTKETYSQVRPRQSPAVFERVIENIKYINSLKTHQHTGVNFTLLHVINKINFHEMKTMVELGHALNARVWLKPFEIHSEIHKKFEIPQDQKHQYLKVLEEAKTLANQLGVELIFDSLNYFKGEQFE